MLKMFFIIKNVIIKILFTSHSLHFDTFFKDQLRAFCSQMFFVHNITLTNIWLLLYMYPELKYQVMNHPNGN